MNKIGWFFGSFCAWLVGFALLITPAEKQQQQDFVFPVEPAPIIPPPQPVEPDCVGVQVPIPKACRVFNKSGSQCVWCSLECLGRHHGVKELYEGDGRITKSHTWATGPGEVSRVLAGKYPSVKWKQIQNKGQVKDFIKKYVCDKKFGVGLGIPGHMLNLVHYDEQAKLVKIIDNGGPRALQIQDWSMDKFEKLMDGWVLTVFPPGYTETVSDFDPTIPDPDKIYGLPTLK